MAQLPPQHPQWSGWTACLDLIAQLLRFLVFVKQPFDVVQPVSSAFGDRGAPGAVLGF